MVDAFQRTCLLSMVIKDYFKANCMHIFKPHHHEDDDSDCDRYSWYWEETGDLTLPVSNRVGLHCKIGGGPRSVPLTGIAHHVSPWRCQFIGSYPIPGRSGRLVWPILGLGPVPGILSFVCAPHVDERGPWPILDVARLLVMFETMVLRLRLFWWPRWHG